MSCPSVFEEVASIFAAYQGMDYPISRTSIERLCYRMILDNLPQGNHSEVAWSLWLIRMLGINIDSQVCLELERIDNSICGIIALDIQERGNTKSKFDTSRLEELIAPPNALQSNMWLLAYENSLRGWIEAPQYESEVFEAMSASKISFYDKTIEDLAMIGDEADDSWYE